jgi:hypothetical protein
VRTFNVQTGTVHIEGEQDPQPVAFLGIRSVPPQAAHIEAAPTAEHHYLIQKKVARRLGRLLLDKTKD